MSHFTTEVWGGGKTFELPASVTTWRLDLLVDVGVLPRLAIEGDLPLVYGDATQQSSSICNWGGMCDDFVGTGDMRLAARSPWDLGPVVVTGRLEFGSGVGYRHGIDDLTAPGDGDTDFYGGLSAGWRGPVGPVLVTISGGGGYEVGFGLPPDAIDVGGGAALRVGLAEAGSWIGRYESLGDLDFAAITSPADFPYDRLRFVDIDNDASSVGVRLSGYAGPRGVHLTAWRLFAVDNGTVDNRGVGLGASSGW